MDVDPRRMTPHRRQHWGVELDPDLEPPDGVPVVPAEPSVRRRLLWRDSATILLGVVLALLTFRILSPPSDAVEPTETPIPSEVSIRLTPPPGTLAPGESFGPIVDPSLGIDATPTPIPVVTLGPTPPRPTSTPAPGATLTPTPRATQRPTAAPSVKPPPTTNPTPTPPPDPTVSVSCTVQAPLTVECTASVTNIQAGSQAWSMDGAGTTLGGGNGTNSITFLYGASNTYTVTVTVTGLDGSTTAQDSTDVTV